MPRVRFETRDVDVSAMISLRFLLSPDISGDTQGAPFVIEGALGVGVVG